MTINKAQLKALALATFEHLPGVRDPKMIVQASDVLFLLAEIDHLERESKSGLIAYKAAIDGQKELREERENIKAENQRLIEHKQGLINLRETHGFESWAAALVEIDRLRAENDALRKDAERYRFLRDMKCNSFTLSRDDDHACNYCTAKQWIEEYCPDSFDGVPAEELQRMKDANTIWRLQIYPSTPVGFVWYHGATPEAAIDSAVAELAGKEACGD